MAYKVLFSNIGYARGIDGSLRQHINFLGRHVYCTLPVQEQVLGQLKTIIDQEQPDLCCFVEIDQGSWHAARLNQIQSLLGTEYQFHDVSDKYGHQSTLGRMLFHKGKSNAFMAKRDLPFERLYFANGTKRLIYKLTTPQNISVFFAHFSLKHAVRVKQFEEMHKLVHDTEGESIVLADFNIMQGFKELQPLLRGENLVVLNKEDEHTFTFHTHKLALDLCICSRSLESRTALKIIPQPFSDHAALLVTIED